MRVLGYIWATPNTLLTALLALIYWPHSWQWRDGALTAVTRRRMIGDPGAQGLLAWIVYYRSAALRENGRLRAHENEHVRQGMIGGPLALLAYALHWLYLFARDQGEGHGPRWHRAYRGVWFEKRARAAEWLATGK